MLPKVLFLGALGSLGGSLYAQAAVPDASPQALVWVGLIGVISMAVAGAVTQIGTAVVKLEALRRDARHKDCEGDLEICKNQLGQELAKNLALIQEIQRWRELVGATTRQTPADPAGGDAAKPLSSPQRSDYK